MNFEELYDIAKLNNITHLCINSADYLLMAGQKDAHKMLNPTTDYFSLSLGFAGSLREEVFLYINKTISRNHYKKAIMQPHNNYEIYWSSEIEFEKGKIKMKFEEDTRLALGSDMSLFLDKSDPNNIFIIFDPAESYGTSIKINSNYDYDKNVLMDTYVRFLTSFENSFKVLNLQKLNIIDNMTTITGVMLFALEFLVSEMKRVEK